MKRRDILDFLHSSLVGHKVKVLEHTDPGLVSRQGIIVSESRQMLTIQENDNNFAVSKEPGTFLFTTSLGQLKIEGGLLEGDAKRRSKRKLRHW